MDIFNRGPSIPEDTLLYVLYPPPPLADKAACTSLAYYIHDLVETSLPTFLWHRDPFQLKIAPDPHARPSEDKNVLEGRMRVGDAIDDEWCVVWLLREISKQWDAVISVSDSDGQFLLIEAAESLPRWVDPSNVTNRVWIYSGRLHLIPPSHVSRSKPRMHPRVREQQDEEQFPPDEECDYIAIEDALLLVRDAFTDTLAPKAVEDIVWQRISGYPSAARNHVHTTLTYLPVDIARALTVDQSLIQKPIETFYTRDAIQLRAAHKMARFPPEPNVLCRVKMTRIAYAQLLGQKFYPPRAFGSFQEREDTPAWRWRDVGMKLACGFEMLFQESKNRSNVLKSTTEGLTSSAEARKDTLRRFPDYKTYLSRLVASGYFRDEVEGSTIWNELEDKAANVYVEVRREDNMTRPSFAALVNAALSRAPEMLLDADLVQMEDSDDWMDVDAKDIDKMLERTMPTSGSAVEMHTTEMDGSGGEEARVTKEQTSKLRDLAAKVEQFVEGSGDMEGACFQDEAFSDEYDVNSDSDTDSIGDESVSDSDDEESDIETQKATEAARQQAMNNLVPALPASEYGQMPASFNTQRVTEVAVSTQQAGLPSNIGRGAPIGSRPIRPPLLPRDKYEGVDSDDESSSSDPFAGGDEDAESEEDRPQLVGELEVDMNEEEAEFLEFSRQTLGISDKMWDDIIRERQGRGAFVPASVTRARKTTTTSMTTSKQPATSVPGVRISTNPNLDSFEAVMQAMDAELLRLQQSSARQQLSPSPPTKKERRKDLDRAATEDDGMSIEATMQAELESMLEQDASGDTDEDVEMPSMDYNLIKNFLESFKSQAGLSGPVSNLAGRLQPGWTLPRDES